MKSLLYILAFIFYSLLSCSSNIPTDMDLGSVKTEQSRLNSSIDSIKKQIELLVDKDEQLEQKFIKESVERHKPITLSQLIFAAVVCVVISLIFFLINNIKSSNINDRVKLRVNKEEVKSLIKAAQNQATLKSNNNDKNKLQQINNLETKLNEITSRIDKLEKELVKENKKETKPGQPVGEINENNQVQVKIGYFGCSLHSGLFKGVFDSLDPDKCFFKVYYTGDKGEFDILDIKKLKSKDWFDASIAETSGIQLSEAISSKTNQKGIVEKINSEGIWKVVSPIKIELYNK